MKVFFPQERVLLLLLEQHFLTTGAPVSHWAFCRETHSNGGMHYHLSSSVLKLRRWNQVKSDHRVSVHFSAKSLGYVAAYRYVCKSDKDVLHSADHTDLQTIGPSPIIKKCIQANNKKASSRKWALHLSRQPLEIIFKCFTSPAQGKYAWTGQDEVEVAFLNDIRWSKELITWHELLSLVEGDFSKLSRPKNVFASDLSIPRWNSISFFATGIKSFEFAGVYGQQNERETDMMDNQWKIFEFTHQISKNESLGIEICPKCFFSFVMLGEDSQWTLN